jgi:hypothetical protein
MESTTYSRSEHARLYDKYVKVFEIADKYAYQVIDGRKVMPNKERQVEHIKDIATTGSYEFLAKLDLINYLKKHFAYLF